MASVMGMVRSATGKTWLQELTPAPSPAAAAAAPAPSAADQVQASRGQSLLSQYAAATQGDPADGLKSKLGAA